MKNVFDISKKTKPYVKIPKYTYIKGHELQPDIHYYIKPYDNNNNYDFMEAKIGLSGKSMFERFTILSGTSIKIIDSFMFSYLKHRKDDKFDFKSENFIRLSLEEAGMLSEKTLKYYTQNVPADFKTNKIYKDTIKDGYDLLYVASGDAENVVKQFVIVFVKEHKVNFMGTDLGYVLFKPISIITKPSYLKGEKTSKYNIMEIPVVTIPTSILK